MSVINKTIKMIVIEVVKHFKAQYKNMWVTNVKVNVESEDESFPNGLYTLAIFDRNVEYDDIGRAIDKEEPVKENQILTLEKFSYNPPTRYTITGTIGEIKTNPKDLGEQLQNPIFAEEGTEEPVRYDPEELAEFSSLERDIANLRAVKERLEESNQFLSTRITEQEERTTELRSEIQTLQNQEQEIINGNWENTIDVVKALCEYLPEKYDNIYKIMIDVREMRRNNRRNSILIQKEAR